MEKERKRKKRLITEYKLSDIYRFYRLAEKAQKKKHIERHTYKRIISDYNLKVREFILMGETYVLPCGAGKLKVGSVTKTTNHIEKYLKLQHLDYKKLITDGDKIYYVRWDKSRLRIKGGRNYFFRAPKQFIAKLYQYVKRDDVLYFN